MNGTPTFEHPASVAPGLPATSGLGVGGWILGAVAVIAAAACGKKGPPLAPLVHIPAAVEQISARRVGSDVYVTVTVPSANIDQFTPADISRVEVFGYTGRTPPPRARWAELGTLVATIPVAPPPVPASENQAPVPAPPSAGAPQGAQATIRDTLTADEVVQGTLPMSPRTGEPTTPRTSEPVILRRFYLAFPWSPRGRVGPPGSVAELLLLPLPDPPPSAAVEYAEHAISLTWEPGGGLIGFLLERTLPEESLPFEMEETPAAEPAATAPVVGPPPPVSDAPVPVAGGPLSYNVYRSTLDLFAPPPENAADVPPWAVQPPVPVNTVPLADLTFTDSVDFGTTRCYTVRSVRGIGTDARVGDPSPSACVRPVDTFAPASPSGLATVASEGAINLIWEPNTEADLGGYLILRGEAADATLQPLTLTPLSEARYRDGAVTPGVRYVYAVVAVDNRFPVPNVSAASTPVEETAR